MVWPTLGSRKANEQNRTEQNCGCLFTVIAPPCAVVCGLQQRLWLYEPTVLTRYGFLSGLQDNHTPMMRQHNHGNSPHHGEFPCHGEFCFRTGILLLLKCLGKLRQSHRPSCKTANITSAGLHWGEWRPTVKYRDTLRSSVPKRLNRSRCRLDCWPDGPKESWGPYPHWKGVIMRGKRWPIVKYSDTLP